MARVGAVRSRRLKIYRKGIVIDDNETLTLRQSRDYLRLSEGVLSLLVRESSH